MHKILIVDDDPTLVDFLKLLLETEGFEVEDASDGESALPKIDIFHPDLILLDYKMPNMDGLEVLRSVRQNHPRAAVVILTGKGSEEVAVECMKAGALDYLPKPFENERLLSAIRSALQTQDAGRL